MRTRVFKKLLSVLCVVSILLSVVVVGFAGTASAATATYTFSDAGRTYQSNLETGTVLAAPASPNTAVKFLGWYDVDGQKHTTAGSQTSLYAKYDGAVQSFDDGKGHYDPNNKFGSGLGDLSYVADPVNAGNKVLRYNNKTNANGLGFGLAANTAAGAAAAGFKVEEGKSYVVTFKAYIEGLTGAQKYRFTVYGAASSGICNAGNKTQIGYIEYFADTGKWVDVTITTSAITASMAQNQPYFYLSGTVHDVASGGSSSGAYCYIDDLGVAPVNTSTVTFHDRGSVTAQTYKIGSALPAATSASFVGWYDKTLTTKYTVAPAVDTDVYALYNGTFVNFEDLGAYDPNNKLGSNTSVSIVKDPLDQQGKVVYANLAGNANLVNFAPAKVEGISMPTKLAAGQYRVKIHYYARNLGEDGVVIQVRTADNAAIGTNAGTKSAVLASATITKKTSGWETQELVFTLSAAAAANDAVIIAIQDGAVALGGSASDAKAQIYIDNVNIKPYAEATVLDTFTMDFEDDFAWSVPAGNDYTSSTGNGYVSRGEIKKEASGNHYFQMKHYMNKNGYFWFTLNNGQKQFELAVGGIYTLSLDYYVEHSETSTSIGVLATKGTAAKTGLKFHTMEVIDSFEYRDDSGWAHAEVTFYADIFDNTDFTSLGVYLYNSTRVPEEYATVVNFDNIVVNTLSVTGEDGLIVFDDKGADYSIDSIVVEGGYTADSIPTPVKFGYDFQGWKYKDADDNEHTLTTKTVITAGLFNVYADWKLSRGAVEINFKSNIPEFDQNAPVLVAYPGEKIAGMPADPSALGQTFLGWYTDTGFTKKLDPNSAPSKSVTAYARWANSDIVIDFDNYDNKKHASAVFSPRFYIKTLEDGNKVLCYDLMRGTDTNPSGAMRAMLYDGASYIPAFIGLDYKITFDYYIVECKEPGQMQIYTSDTTNTWSNAAYQSGTIHYQANLNEWFSGQFIFTAKAPDNGAAPKNLSFAVSGDAILYIDNVVVTTPENALNHYGTAVMLDTNGGEELNTISGEAGTPMNLPIPKRAGFLFTGWYTDKELTTRYTETVFPEQLIQLYAGWKLGKISESFENFPTSIRALGFSGAYKFYSKDSMDFDASNIRTGSFSLFRNGNTTGDKSFTIARKSDMTLAIGSDYTLSFWVKPTEITDPNCAISISSIPSIIDIGDAEIIHTITTASELTVGEWQKVTYHFTAEASYIALTTGHGCDMYIDDVELLLDGYTGTNTGDDSVSPCIVLAMIIVCAGALILTSKKVFAK